MGPYVRKALFFINAPLDLEMNVPCLTVAAYGQNLNQI